MATQFVTYYLDSYKSVLEKSKAVESIEGKVIIIKTNHDTFNDPASVLRYNYEAPISTYMLVAQVPMSAAIKFC